MIDRAVGEDQEFMENTSKNANKQQSERSSIVYENHGEIMKNSLRILKEIKGKDKISHNIDPMAEGIFNLQPIFIEAQELLTKRSVPKIINLVKRK